MKQFSYLLIEFSTVIVCFVKSFDRKIRFNTHFGPFLLAAALVAVPFITWDILFTARGIWWFNPDYTIGLSIAGLPVEEYLFFICIPFSCVFTYCCFQKFIRLTVADAFGNIIVFVSVIVFCVTALHYQQRTYTLVASTVAAGTLIFLHLIARVNWIGSASSVFVVLMLGLLPVNGALTGTGLDAPIVHYNKDEIIGIRLLTFRVEDIVYGYTHFLLVLYCFKKFQPSQHRP